MDVLQRLVEGTTAIQHFFMLLAYQIARFVLIAGLFYQFLWRAGARRFAHLRIQSGVPPSSLVRRGLALSLSSMAVFSLTAFIIHAAESCGWSRIYFDVSEHGWPWFWFTVVAMIVVHDAHFYWIHRLLHWKPLFRHVHVVHHRFTNPEPWGSFAFHPVEALALFAVVPVMTVVMPIHFLALIIFVMFMTLFTVVGHVGFEIYPSGITRHWLLGWINTSTHHNMHHRYSRCNYGLYFNFWDHWMGTNHPRYHETFDAVKRGQPMHSTGARTT